MTQWFIQMAVDGEPIAVVVVDLRHRTGGRPQHLCLLGGVLGLGQAGNQAVPEFHRAPEHRRFLLALEGDHQLVAEGRDVLHLAQTNFHIVEPVVILPRGKTDELVVGDHGLDDGPAGLLSPARPAHHLGQQVKGGLSRPVAPGVQ